MLSSGCHNGLKHNLGTFDFFLVLTHKVCKNIQKKYVGGCIYTTPYKIIAVKIANVMKDVIRLLLQFAQNQRDDVKSVGGRVMSSKLL